MELIGYELSRDQVKSGEPIVFTTYWRSDGAFASTDLPLHGNLTLLEPDGVVLDHAEPILGDDTYPNWAWRPGEIVVTKFQLIGQVDVSTIADASLIVPPSAAAIDLGRVVVKNDQSCNVDRSTDTSFGGSIKLLGYHIDQSNAVGAPPRVVLCWQSIKPTPIDYTVFVHATDEAGNTIIGDAQPRGGNYPTSVWSVGEQIEDSHPLPVAVDLVIKQVAVGLYRLDTGERLTIDGTNETEFVIPNSQ